MSSIRAIVVDPEVPGRLAIKEVEAPQAGPSEALVQVEAISLNRGEVLGAMHAEAGWRPGWDLAGTVIKQAANGTGPKAGSRALFRQAHGQSRWRFRRTGWPNFPPA